MNTHNISVVRCIRVNNPSTDIGAAIHVFYAAEMNENQFYFPHDSCGTKNAIEVLPLTMPYV